MAARARSLTSTRGAGADEPRGAARRRGRAGVLARGRRSPRSSGPRLAAASARLLAPLRARSAARDARRPRRSGGGWRCSAAVTLLAGGLAARPDRSAASCSRAAGPAAVARASLGARRRRYRAELARAAPRRRAGAGRRARRRPLDPRRDRRGRRGGVPGAAGTELRARRAALALGEPHGRRRSSACARACAPRRRGTRSSRRSCCSATPGGDLAGLLREPARGAGGRPRGSRRDARAGTAQARFTGLLVAVLPLGAAALAELAQPGLPRRSLAAVAAHRVARGLRDRLPAVGVRGDPPAARGSRDGGRSGVTPRGCCWRSLACDRRGGAASSDLAAALAEARCGRTARARWPPRPWPRCARIGPALGAPAAPADLAGRLAAAGRAARSARSPTSWRSRAAARWWRCSAALPLAAAAAGPARPLVARRPRPPAAFLAPDALARRRAPARPRDGGGARRTCSTCCASRSQAGLPLGRALAEVGARHGGRARRGVAARRRRVGARRAARRGRSRRCARRCPLPGWPALVAARRARRAPRRPAGRDARRPGAPRRAPSGRRGLASAPRRRRRRSSSSSRSCSCRAVLLLVAAALVAGLAH